MQSYPPPNTMPADGGGGVFYSQSSNQQQQESGVSNPEELQLTAQLSRTLAPIMNASPGGVLSEGQDPRGNVQGQHQYHHEQPQLHAAHLQASPHTDSMAGQYSASPDTSNRKRAKTTRACDECRRKKIRCDAETESGDQQCSSCKRIGTRCQFSRVPMKRGPSKGYIRELADRLQNLEGQVQHGVDVSGQQYLHQDSSLQRRASEEFSASQQDTDKMQRKRNYSSSVSGDFGTPYQSQRPASGWASQEPPRQLPHPSTPFSIPQSAPAPSTTAFREPDYSPNGLQPTPQWRTAPEPPRRRNSFFESMPQADPSHAERVADWDEGIVEAYYDFIHPTYPLLPHSKNRLRNNLANSPVPLKETFYEALDAAVRSFPTPTTPSPEQQSSRKAAQLFLDSRYENAAGRTMATNLIYLQVMLLMAIEAENCDPARGQVGLEWLGGATELAYTMKLHSQKLPTQQAENDHDSDERLARRVWWSLVIMDRWRAASISRPLLIPDTSVVVSQDDQTLLGEGLYHLARLSIVLGHFTLIPTDLPDLTVPSITLLTTLARGELERFRESLPTSFFPPLNAPVLHICYWYVRTLMAMRLPEYGPQEVCEPAVQIITQLKNSVSLISPLTHHATALAAVALIDCMGYESSRKEAEGGLSILLESRIAPSGWDASIREMIIKSIDPSQISGAGGAVAARSGTSQHTAIQSLQHLAELATATKEGKAEGSTSEGRKGSGAVGQTFQRFPNLREVVSVGYWSKLGAADAGR